VFQARFRPEVERDRWPAIRAAFAGFSLREIARWPGEVAEALAVHPGVIRNGDKLRDAIRNARDLERRAREAGSALAYLDSFRPDAEALVRDLDTWAHYVGAPSLRSFVRCAGVTARWRSVRRRARTSEGRGGAGTGRPLSHRATVGMDGPRAGGKLECEAWPRSARVVLEERPWPSTFPRSQS